MEYIIYKTTNLVNGKFYIGRHKTKNIEDGYLGSGKVFRSALKKYGEENFSREILHRCKSENEMHLAEKIFVVLDPEVSYNVARGGPRGGFDHINRNSSSFKGRKHSPEAKARISAKLKGHKVSVETKEKLSQNHVDKPRQKGTDGRFMAIQMVLTGSS
jgi:hypothetical protein